MKNFFTFVMPFLLIGLFTGTATAQTPAQTPQNAAATLKTACQNELDTYCKAVTPGEGRAFACLYAYSDKLSGRCEQALFNASMELEYVISKLNYVANTCAADIDKLCSGTEPGQGRIADCLKQNETRVSAECQQAIKETGMTSP